MSNADYYLKLIKVHELKADEIGFIDNVCKNYTKERALKHLDDCGCFIIFNNDNTSVGMLTYKLIEEEGEQIVDIWGYVTDVLSYLQDKFSVLSLECWAK